MLVIPAIDLRGGRCVRLRQGDYARETIFSDDPADMAQRWVERGARFLHIVDLDGAREGKPVNLSAVEKIIARTAVPCQLGGGLRTEADLQSAFRLGVQRVVLGTRAFKAPQWFADMGHAHPGKLMLGLDAKDGLVATHGWLEVSQVPAVDALARFQDMPLAGLIYTDISRDGMLQGPNFDGIAAMTAAAKMPVFASGGVTTLADVQRLAQLAIAGCIIGRALYEGTIELSEAIQAGAPMKGGSH